MKKIFFIAAAAVISITASGQEQQIFRVEINKDGGSGAGSMRLGSIVQQKVIGQATLRCTYDYRYVTDTTDRAEKAKTDVMILQAGGDFSKFYSYLTFRADSLLRQATSPDQVMADLGRYRSGESWILYKNYPQGKITLTDKVAGDQFLYEEELQPQQWEILDEARQIEGYTCQKAECDFRGHHWTAWFTTDIPLSEGPWKLHGLPGLILQAYDRNEDYSFTLTGLKQVDGEDISWAEYQYMKTSRKDYLNTLRKFLEDPVGMMSRTGAVIKVTGADGSAINLEPKPLKYDFIETDIK